MIRGGLRTDTRYVCRGRTAVARSAAPLATRRSITSNLAAWAALAVPRSRLPRTRLSSAAPAIPRSPNSAGVWSAPTATSWSPKSATGKVVARRLFNPGFRPSEYFHELNLLETRLDALAQRIPYLTRRPARRPLSPTFVTSTSAPGRPRRPSSGRPSGAASTATAPGRPWAAPLASAGARPTTWRRCGRSSFSGEDGQFCNQLQNSTLQEVTWYIVASQTNAPQFWLAYAEDRKAENPSYSICRLSRGGPAWRGRRGRASRHRRRSESRAAAGCKPTA